MVCWDMQGHIRRGDGMVLLHGMYWRCKLLYYTQLGERCIHVITVYT